MVRYAIIDGKKLGSLRKPLIEFARFPHRIKEVLNSNELNGKIPRTYIQKEVGFQEINKLNKNLYGITSIWNKKAKEWEIILLNLKDDNLIHKWVFSKRDFVKNKIEFPVSTIKNPILLEHKNIIGRLSSSANLFRMDSSSNIIWKNEEMSYHHSLNLAEDGNIWTCARGIFNGRYEKHGGAIVRNLNGEYFSYKEENIVKVDVNTGKILFKKGLSEILLENGYKGILYCPELYDPFHINDIEPALSDTKFWKKDDVFISSRRRSLVILYRPSTNKVIKLIQGPFVNQHDVDIISNNEISIFNNNIIYNIGYNIADNGEPYDSLPSNEVIIYNFEQDSFSYFANNIFQANKIATKAQGLSEFLSDGSLFIEELNSGKYYIINDSSILLKKVLETDVDGYIHKPNWMRIYEDLPF